MFIFVILYPKKASTACVQKVVEFGQKRIIIIKKDVDVRGNVNAK